MSKALFDPFHDTSDLPRVSWQEANRTAGMPVLILADIDDPRLREIARQVAEGALYLYTDRVYVSRNDPFLDPDRIPLERAVWVNGDLEELTDEGEIV